MWPIVFLSVVVGFNNFFGAMALSSLSRRRLPIIITFGVFLFTITFLGAYLGGRAVTQVPDFGAWLAPALLLGLGAWIIWSAFRPLRQRRELAQHLTSWPGLVGFAFAFSWDEMLVGLSLGLEGHHPLWVAGIVGTGSLLFTTLGTLVGNQVKKNWQKEAHVLAGAILITFGLVSFFSEVL